jgi:hypothetical protein
MIMGTVVASVAAILALAATPAVASGTSQYQIRASVGRTAPHIRGTMRVRVANTSAVPLAEIPLVIFPNRFATATTDTEYLNDVTRPFVYPHERFVAGGMRVERVVELRTNGDDAANHPSAVHWGDVVGLPPGCVLWIELRRVLPPGDSIDIGISFATTVPERFGAFGRFHDILTALGGWHPYLPGLSPGGRWLLDAFPPAADFDTELSTTGDLELLLNGRHVGTEGGPLRAKIDDVHLLSLVAAPRFEHVEGTAGSRRIHVYLLPRRFTHRLWAGPLPSNILFDAVTELGADPALDLGGDRTRPLVIVETPLRLQLTHPGEGMVAVSDRLYHVQRLLQPFHRRQLAAGVAYELARPAVTAREGPTDYHWVASGLARTAADTEQQRSAPNTRSVRRWIEIFDVVAIVDRFESEPKIPFVEAFFDQLRVEDPAHQSILTFNNRIPPGPVIFEKLDARIGAEAVAALRAGYATHAEPLREQATAAAGEDLTGFFDAWAQPYPALDYVVERVDRNQPHGDGFRHRARVVRRSSRPLEETVPVRFEARGDGSVTMPWRSDGGQRDVDHRDGDRSNVVGGEIWATTPIPIKRVRIDPDRQVLEETRANNAEPRPLQVVIDSADVTVTSTQFGLAALGVMRHRYDYRKDLATLGFLSERGLGGHVGARYHWGPQVDATLYRHNLFGFFTAMKLDEDFKDDSRPRRRDDGTITGFGARYDYGNVLGPDNPTNARKARLFVDWYDDRIAGDFSFVNWGAIVSGTFPIRPYQTILALQLANGFGAAIAGSRVPNQGRYSLGGDQAIRGIGVEDELGRHLALLRAEVRQSVFPELDFNLLNWLTMRRSQVRLFVDTGRVANDLGTLYDPSHFAVGVGIGLAAVYDFFGFFPGIAFIEVAGRVDRFHDVDNGPQVLLGTRQAF